jgi:hypothetical protein
MLTYTPLGAVSTPIVADDDDDDGGMIGVHGWVNEAHWFGNHASKRTTKLFDNGVMLLMLHEHDADADAERVTLA